MVVGEVEFGEVDQPRISVVTSGPCPVFCFDPADTVDGQYTHMACAGGELSDFERIRSDQSAQAAAAQCLVHLSKTDGVEAGSGVGVALLKGVDELEAERIFQQAEGHRAQRGHGLAGLLVDRFRGAPEPELHIRVRLPALRVPGRDPVLGRRSVARTQLRAESVVPAAGYCAR